MKLKTLISNYIDFISILSVSATQFALLIQNFLFFDETFAHKTGYLAWKCERRPKAKTKIEKKLYENSQEIYEKIARLQRLWLLVFFE